MTEKANELLGYVMAFAVVVWTIVGAYGCVKNWTGETIEKAASVDINAGSGTIEMWRVKKNTMDCMVGIHVFNNVPGQPAQMHLECKQ